MKCPKCGYISFDYNQVCPKCNRNISAEQEKIFLPSFRPDPPSLLGFLTGEANESNLNLRAQQDSPINIDHSENLSLNGSAILDKEGFGLDEQDLEMSFPPEDSGQALFNHESEVEPQQLFSDSDFSLEQKEEDNAVAPLKAEEEEETALDLGDLSIEEPGDLFGGFSLDDSEMPQESAPALEFDDADLSLESLDSLPAEIGQGGNELESEIELNLDDLKIGNLGDLEMGAEQNALEKELEGTFVEPDRGLINEENEAEGLILEDADAELDKLPDLSDLIGEEAGTAAKERTMILDDFSLDDAETAGGTGGFEFDDIPLEISEPEDGGLDFADFSLDANDSGETTKPLSMDDLSLNDSGELEKSFDLSGISIDEDFDQEKPGSTLTESLPDSDEIDLDLDAMSLDVEEYQKKPASDRDDFVLDLEDMDIDLDLNEPKK
jgi:hypothetical protein